MSLRDFYRGMSYRKKLMVSYLALVLIPMGIIAIFTYNYTYRTIRDQSLAVFENDMNRVRSQLEQRLDVMEQSGQRAAGNSQIIRYFNSRSESKSDQLNNYYSIMQPVMEWITALDDANTQMRFFTANPNVLQSKRVYPIQVAQGDDWFDRVKTATYAQPVWEPFHAAREYDVINKNMAAGSNMAISLFVSVAGVSSADDRGTLLEVSLSAEDLFAPFSDDSNSLFFALDGGSQMLFCGSDDPLIIDHLLSGDWRTQQDNFVRIGGSNYYVASGELSRVGCSVVTLHVADEAVRRTRAAGLLSVIIIVSALVVVAWVSAALSKSMVRKIDGLLTVTRSVQSGDLTVRAVVEGGDEIDQLAKDFNRMVERINELINTVYRFSMLQKDALYQSLQSQINPHFLYNTIETIRMMAERQRERDIADALESFGGMMRYNVTSAQEIVTLADEIEQVKAYANLSNLMLNDKLLLEIDVNPHVLSARIPKLCIQPLVENAIKYGYDEKRPLLKVRVESQSYNSLLHISVGDDGHGMQQGYVDQLNASLQRGDAQSVPGAQGTGIGLMNVHQRIRLKYGDAYGMRVSAHPDKGTVIHLNLPFITQDDEAGALHPDRPGQ